MITKGTWSALVAVGTIWKQNVRDGSSWACPRHVRTLKTAFLLFGLCLIDLVPMSQNIDNLLNLPGRKLMNAP